jgi:hypothetical protein
VANTRNTGGSERVENSYGEPRRLSENHAKMQTLMHYVNRENLKAEHRAQVRGKAAGGINRFIRSVPPLFLTIINRLD